MNQDDEYEVLFESIADWLGEKSLKEDATSNMLLAAVRPHVISELRTRLTPLLDKIRPGRAAPNR